MKKALFIILILVLLFIITISITISRLIIIFYALLGVLFFGG